MEFQAHVGVETTKGIERADVELVHATSLVDNAIQKHRSRVSTMRIVKGVSVR